MTSSPKITSILAVPGFAPPPVAGGLPSEDEPASLPREMVSIGLVLDGQEVIWGDCLLTAGLLPEKEHPFNAREALTTIQKTLPRFLRGAALDNFPAIAQKIDTHLEQTGQTGQVRLIHPALRYGLQQALLGVAARKRQTGVIQAIADMYGFPTPPNTPPPLHLEAGYPPLSLKRSPLLRQAASIGLTTSAEDVETELGKAGQILQRHVRALREELNAIRKSASNGSASEEAADLPAIHLNVRGGLGKLYDNQFGKIMGALFGLEAAAAAYTLRVEDPLLMDASLTHTNTIKELKNYLQLRRMKAKLVIGSHIRSLKNIQDIIDDDQAAHMVRLRTANFGSLHQTIKAIAACREKGMPVLLEAGAIETGRSIQTLAQLAMATQPDFVTAEPGTITAPSLLALHSEMARLTAWSGSQSSKVADSR
jgi:methylaspartate ammonia-lyase